MGELMAIAQEHRRIAISTPLGKDVLLLRAFTGSEAISQLFHFDLDLLSENDSVKFQDVVGKNVTLRIYDKDGGQRYWNGFISRFSQGAQDRRLTAYRAQMVPWFWFLTRTADCRIFQSQKVPDIIQKIFSDLKFHDFELRLYGNYAPRDYCVQYRETDFNFVSRLMEEEGICYYFEHQDGKHVLILADDTTAHKPCPNQPTARCGFYGQGITYTEDLVTDWHHHEEFRPGAWAQTDYNFETPSTSLAVTVNGKNPYEIYEFPGEHRIRAEGDRLARIRLQEQTAPCLVSQGESMCRHFCSGFQFTLQDHYRGDLNQAYLLTAVRHMATVGGNYQVGADGGQESTYRNSFECIPFSTPYRPARVTPQPFVQGCQTAVVVGPAGEEIYTDKYGRVKVQFHWDREGKKNENSSCWIRVSHPWAGKGYGSVSIPRIDQEVIVDFLEGDPDQPIIVGRVYNAEQMPPTGLPAAGMVSGVKSNSTPGGGGYNQMTMDDTKGKEKIDIRAQYDMNVTVEHDRTKTINNNETTKVVANRTEHVIGHESITIDGGREETVSSGEKITITGGRTENVSGGEKITITGGRTEGVDGSEKITIAGGRTENVTGGETITITGAQNITVNGSRTENVTSGEQITITGNTTHKVTGDLTIHATGTLGELGDGGVTINGPEITVQAKGNCNIIGGAKLTLAGPGGSIVIDGSGVTIQGTMVSIN
jgi:type VI secretion system secreted protein VgrG